MKISIPENVKLIMQTLLQNGFDAYVVGGCVRNAMMGIMPHDWDICTDAKPDEMKRVFSGFATHDFGLKHGTLVVMAENEPLEVTTYRIDGVYTDNRHPESVTFTDDLTADLSRRDFTVNAMAYNHIKGIVDPYGGEQDVRDNVLRCVGVSDLRFHEDALRILRGLRFASVYGFEIEKQTARSIKQNAGLLRNIAQERIREELTGLLCGKNVLSVADEFRDVIAVAIPELEETFDFPQNSKHHQFDVWRHILRSVAYVESDPLLRVTMLLHDIGKPRACTTDENGFNHFKGHQQISAEMSEIILKRLRFPNAFVQSCLQLIMYHDVRFDGSEKQVKHVLQALGKDQMRLLFKVQRADIAAQSDYRRAEKLAAVDKAELQTEEVLRQNRCFSLKQLAVNGADLIALGIPEGRAVGSALNELLTLVISNDLPNEKAALLAKAKDYIP